MFHVVNTECKKLQLKASVCKYVLYMIIVIMGIGKTGRMVQMYKCKGQTRAQENHGDIKFCVLENSHFKIGKR